MEGSPTITDKDDVNDTVIINVGGVRHEILRRTLRRLPTTKLASFETMEKHYRNDKGDYFFDRHPSHFVAILNYYRTEELHVPKDACGPEFSKELSFWGISEEDIEECCWIRYNADRVHRQALRVFNQTFASDDEEGRAAGEGGGPSSWHQWRAAVWKVLDDPQSGKLARAYSILSFAVVLLAVGVFCAETDPSTKTNLTAEHYAEIYNVPLDHVYADWYDAYPDDPGGVTIPTGLGRDARAAGPEAEGRAGNLGSATSSIEGQARRKRRDASPEGYETPAFDFDFDAIPDGISDTDISRSQDNNNVADIRDGPSPLYRVRRDVLVTVSPDGDAKERPPGKYKRFGHFTVSNRYIDIIDTACMAFFTLEVIVRFAFCPRKPKFFTKVLNLIDILCILPFYIELVVHSVNARQKFETNFIDALHSLKLLRIFRILRLLRHYRGLQILAYTLKFSARELLLLLTFLMIAMLIFSTLMFYVNMNEEFTSIPRTFWWAIVTMTTVGYGDMVPTTAWGYLIGSLCSISGVVVIAFSVPTIVNNFLMFYNSVQYQRGGHAYTRVARRVSASAPEEAPERLTCCGNGAPKLELRTIKVAGQNA